MPTNPRDLGLIGHAGHDTALAVSRDRHHHDALFTTDGEEPGHLGPVGRQLNIFDEGKLGEGARRQRREFGGRSWWRRTLGEGGRAETEKAERNPQQACPVAYARNRMRPSQASVVAHLAPPGFS